MVLVHVAYVSQALPGGNASVVHSFTSTISTILSLFNNLSQKYYTLHNYIALIRFERFSPYLQTGMLFIILFYKELCFIWFTKWHHIQFFVRLIHIIVNLIIFILIDFFKGNETWFLTLNVYSWSYAESYVHNTKYICRLSVCSLTHLF